MNKFVALNNKIEGKDNIIKIAQYLSLFLASNLESSSLFKQRFYESYCKRVLLTQTYIYNTNNLNFSITKRIS